MAARTDVTAAPNPATPAAAKPELANHVAQQIVDVAKTLPNRPVEISLNPEELGRLKLHLVTSEAGIAVHVSAERPETMDLLRRHIGILDQEFLKLGFEDVAFSFAGGQGPQDQADPSNGQSPEHQGEIADPLAPAETPPAPATLPREGGLDLRL
ncbi:flagellar hook-length control protein FliK [Sulfitobacter mediterraneus]|nr:flagellar hook-length control protein FliK [Sulfitobacter mediterraneus]MBM1641062.1 flagellar hook-length control protein FliK [Sulfitobacter mediterraneus]MBM1657275.1 flagellar hook-length control protein FliK [Sulfitobacter mediterraneus]MCD2360664.1 flagellar hook-length control protein FliK [Sulfitobacter mediterraneus]